jgi:hypothetical protein
MKTRFEIIWQSGVSFVAVFLKTLMNASYLVVSFNVSPPPHHNPPIPQGTPATSSITPQETREAFMSQTRGFVPAWTTPHSFTKRRTVFHMSFGPGQTEIVGLLKNSEATMVRLDPFSHPSRLVIFNSDPSPHLHSSSPTGTTSAFSFWLGLDIHDNTPFRASSPATPSAVTRTHLHLCHF